MSHESKYFSRGEFACQYTGENEIKDELIKKLDLLRAACGFPSSSPAAIEAQHTP
jgi:hypothetical protein